MQLPRTTADSGAAENLRRLTMCVLPRFRREAFSKYPVMVEEVAPGTPAVGLFELPKHLMKKWADAIDSQGDLGDGFQISPKVFTQFAEAVIEFLRFKKTPRPAECRCDLARITTTGVRIDAKGSEDGSRAESLLVINLGPEVAVGAFDSPDGSHFDAAGSTGGECKMEERKPDRARLHPGEGCALLRGVLSTWECAGDGSNETMILVIAAAGD